MHEAGANAFTLSPMKWVESINAIGIVVKRGRGGGTYAHKDIAFKFAAWLSAEFELYIVKDYQRLKTDENSRLSLGWNVNREIAKLNYRIHTDAIKTYTMIAKELTKRGIPTPMGKDTWRMATIRSILQSETYRGSKEMQKTYCVNYLTKAKKTNEGELPKYWIEESHEAIIPRDEFDAVQAEIERRKQNGGSYKALSPFF